MTDGLPESSPVTCVALSGGVGGAKLALGLARAVQTEALLIVANTGDDFEHLGLHISPDLDTLMYTLAGINNPQTGWGRNHETWTFMTMLESLGGESWFRLGDGDLAIHVERTRRLSTGATLTAITADFTARLGITARIVPMSDNPVRTVVETAAGSLAFQHYFVRERCKPRVSGFRFEGAAAARANAVLLEALGDPALSAIVICPSNPFISIDPILALPDMRTSLSRSRAPVIAVSPVVAGRAIKGPTTKMMRELAMPVTAAAVAHHYGDLLDGFVLDSADACVADQVRESGIDVLVTDTVMATLADKQRLACAVLDFAERCHRRR